MEFRQLEAFIAVVEWNSFSMAAKKLYLTQPTVSTHIRALEKELDTTLLNRTTKQLDLTQEGDWLYRQAKQIMELKEQIYDRFGNESLHSIRLGASTVPSLYVLPRVLPLFHKKFPLVKLELWQSDSLGVLERLREKQLDIGLVGTRTEDSFFQFIPFAKDTLVIAAPYNTHFLELKKKGCDLETLLREPIILRESTSGTRKEATRFLEKMKVNPEELHVVAQMNDQEMIKASIKSGLGISIMSGYAVKKEEAHRELLVFHPEGYVSQRKLYLVYEKSKSLSPHIQQLVHTITGAFKLEFK